MQQDHSQDELRMCIDCGKRFTWTAGEQAFYASKQLTPPMRCPGCRERRRRTFTPARQGRR